MGASKASVDVVAMDEPALPTSRGLIEHVLSRTTERPADFGHVIEAEVSRERWVDAVVLEHGAANFIIVLICEGILLVPDPHPTPVSLHSGQDGLEFRRGFVASGVKPVATGAGFKATGSPYVQGPFEKCAPQVGTAAGDEDSVTTVINMGETTKQNCRKTGDIVFHR
jgi:hypothetical protein